MENKELLEKIEMLEEKIKHLEEVIEEMQDDLDFASRAANAVWNNTSWM